MENLRLFVPGQLDRSFPIAAQHTAARFPNLPVAFAGILRKNMLECAYPDRWRRNAGMPDSCRCQLEKNILSLIPFTRCNADVLEIALEFGVRRIESRRQEKRSRGLKFRAHHPRRLGQSIRIPRSFQLASVSRFQQITAWRKEAQRRFRTTRIKIAPGLSGFVKRQQKRQHAKHRHKLWICHK